MHFGSQFIGYASLLLSTLAELRCEFGMSGGDRQKAALHALNDLLASRGPWPLGYAVRAEL